MLSVGVAASVTLLSEDSVLQFIPEKARVQSVTADVFHPLRSSHAKAEQLENVYFIEVTPAVVKLLRSRPSKPEQERNI